MNWLDRSDDKWMQQTFDSRTRKARIGTLSTNRTLLFWVSLFGIVAYIVSMFARLLSNRPSMDGIVLGVVAMWMSYSHIEQELRMLRLVERLQPKSIESADTLPLRLDGSIRSEGTK